MSSQPPSDAPSPAAEPEDTDLARSALVRLRGAPLLDALERHAPGSRTHAEAVATYAFAAAVELGFGRGRAEMVREAAKLHAIGRVYVPKDALARRHTGLSDEESELLDSHFETGGRLAHGAGVPEAACEWIAAAGEHYDGAGPGALAGEQIPVEARIIRAACECDAAMVARVRESRGSERRGPRRMATDALRAEAGTELDPAVVDAVIAVLERTAASG